MVTAVAEYSERLSAAVTGNIDDSDPADVKRKRKVVLLHKSCELRTVSHSVLVTFPCQGPICEQCNPLVIKVGAGHLVDSTLRSVGLSCATCTHTADRT